jgi:hypothetical protein
MKLLINKCDPLHCHHHLILNILDIFQLNTHCIGIFIAVIYYLNVLTTYLFRTIKFITLELRPNIDLMHVELT